MKSYHLPPCSNRGVTAHFASVNLIKLSAVAMRIYRHLDWLSITFSDSVNWKRLFGALDWRLTGKGRHGYQAAYTDAKTGATLETGSADKAMGTHITLSGVPLHELKAIGGLSDDDLVKTIKEAGGKCSRIDMAIDCFHAEFTPDMLNEAIMDGSAKLRARTWRYIDGHKSGIRGSTVDTGSASSDKRFRFYDKRAEMRIKDGEAWVRLELQLRRLYARNAIGSCGTNGVEPTINGHISDYLRWDNSDYTAIMDAQSAPPERTKRPDSKRRAWLKGQVARALASELAFEPEFRAEFDMMVGFWLDKLTNTDIS